MPYLASCPISPTPTGNHLPPLSAPRPEMSPALGHNPHLQVKSQHDAPACLFQALLTKLYFQSPCEKRPKGPLSSGSEELVLDAYLESTNVYTGLP